MVHLRSDLVLVAALVLGCSAGETTPSAGGQAAGGSSAGGDSAGGNGSGAQSFGGNPATGGQGGFAECTKFSAEATQAPAALLFALDMSASMNTANKWSTAQLSVVSAMDTDAFDNMSLGLVTFPTSFASPPACVCDYIESMYGPGTCGLALPNGVSCGYSGLPQVAIAPSGADKSNAPSGVRHDMYQYLVTHTPLSNDDDGSPVYDALVSGYDALKAQAIDRRVLVLITDGGFSCTSVSARDGYTDAFGCHDWEFPDSVNQLITAARTDPQKPIYTFVIGVPGSDSVGQKVGTFDTPPYHMKLALSTYAVAGAPDAVDPACSLDAIFAQNGADPAAPCHFDLSNGNAFNPDTLASVLSAIRGKALGCTYDLPPPPMGQELDPALVNVDVTLEGTTAPVLKRADPNDTCELDGCWDYNSTGQVEILGKTCDDIAAATMAKVDIKVGCTTIVK